MSEIESIDLNHNYIYDYKSYKEKKGIFVYPKSTFISNSKVNQWSKLKNTFQSKIEIRTKDDIFNISSKLIFGNIEDWELFKYLAILSSTKNKIEYTYFLKGEKYGQSELTVVEKNFTLVKSIFFVINNSRVPLKKFIIDFEKKTSINNLNLIVKDYFKEEELPF